MSTEARPFHLPGRQWLDALGARVQQTLPDLVLNWWGESGFMQLVGVGQWSDDLKSSSIHCVVREDADRWLGLLGAEHAWMKLAEGWLRCEVSAAGPLVSMLQREFCLALYRQLVGPDAAAVVLHDAGWSQIPPAALSVHAGTTVIELDIDGVPLTLLAPIMLWPDLDAWGPLHLSDAAQSRAEALSDSRVTLEVRLPCVRVPMVDMTGLATGDFLDLEHDVSGRARVLVRGIDLELAAELGQSDGQRVARIVRHQ